MEHPRPFQRLTNRSVRYGPTIIIDDSESDESDQHQPPLTPFSPRLPSDESDTSSVATDSTEETVTDNGEEHTPSYRARVLARYRAQYRFNNTIDLLDDKLQHVNDGAINGFQSVHRGVTAGADYLYDDLAWPFYQEAKLQLEVAARMFVFTLAYLGACILDLLRWCLGVSRWLWAIVVDLAECVVVILSFLAGHIVDMLRWWFRGTSRFPRWLWAIVADLAECLVIILAFLVDRIVDLLRRCGRVTLQLTGWLWRVGVDSAQDLAVSLGRAPRICVGVISNLSDTFLHWLTHGGGLRLVTFVAMSTIVSFSILQGWLGMSVYRCDTTVHNNTGSQIGQSYWQPNCELDSVSNTIQIVNSELAALLDASNTVFQTTDDLGIRHPNSINVHRPAEQLRGTLSRLNRFLRDHKLSDPMISSEDTVALATIHSRAPLTLFANMHHHAVAIAMNADVVKHEMLIRYDELNIRLNSLQEYAKKVKPHSAVERFLSEAFSFITFHAFSFTYTHRQASDYAKLARHILEHNSTLSILEKPSDIAWRLQRISDLMVPTRDHLDDFQYEYDENCQQWNAGWGDADWEEIRDAYQLKFTQLKFTDPKKEYDMISVSRNYVQCEHNPEYFVTKIAADIAQVQTAMEALDNSAAQHETILKALVAVHKQVNDLLDNAAGWTGAPKTPRLLPDLLNPRSPYLNADGLPTRKVWPGRLSHITPMSARAILHRLVAHVGGMNIKLGRTRYDEIPFKNNKWQQLPDGTIRLHPVHPFFWNNVDYPGKPQRLPWTERVSEWIGQMVDDYL